MTEIKKSKSKKINNNTDELELTKDRRPYEFNDGEANSYFPEKGNWRKRLIFTLLKWAENEDSYYLGQFCIKWHLPEGLLRAWVRKYEDVAKAVADAKLMIATHKQVGALTKKLDKDVVFKDLHVYDPQWKEINQYWADLKASENNNAPFILQMQAAESTGRVKQLPPKKIQELEE